MEVKGSGWVDEAIDLNKPPHKNHDVTLNYVLLQKDFKNICRMKVVNAPMELPSIWSIITFVPTQRYQLSNFPKFSLLPCPEDDRQNSEWGKFMRYLWVHKRAGIVTFGSFTLHILAPQSHDRPTFSHAVILYETEPRKDPLVGRKNALKSEGSNKSEEICDNVTNSKITSHKLREAEFSPCESVEDGPRILDPIVKKRTSTPTKKFVSTSPTYLLTLSQTHAGWIFGAIAELIDNSKDACASRLDISIQSMFSKKADGKVPVLCVTDDGHGMTYDEMMRMISFGHKRPNEHCKDQIGRFGIGFKTGAMKLGKDALVLTQTSTSRSVSFLSQSFNENKDNLEIPVITYRKEGQYMEVDLTVQSEATAEYNLNAIKEFSPFNEYFIGEKLGLFGEEGTGTQVYIWNLDRWGHDYTLDWDSGRNGENSAHHGCGNILIRSRRVRLRPGQTSSQVPLDYSLQSYLEVMFRNPLMKITVQGSMVKAHSLDRTLNKTTVMTGEIMGRTIKLTLGRSKIEWDRMNCGIFLYWHGRLIESYKRVGGQKYNADMGRGVIGVADITELIDDEDGNSWVLNSKQGFQDCEMYAKLEDWLGKKMDEYWETNFENMEVIKRGDCYKADHEWVQCYSCRKWRILNAGFNTDSLPDQWFCYMPPFNGTCAVLEQHMDCGVITVGEKRSGNDVHKRIALEELPAKVYTDKMRYDDCEVQTINRGKDVKFAKNVKVIPTVATKRKISSSGKNSIEDDFEADSSHTEAVTFRPISKLTKRSVRRSSSKWL